MDSKPLTDKIKDYASNLGFDACTVCKAEEVDGVTRQAVDKWLANGYHADMQYLERNKEVRLNPSLITSGAKSIVMLALNYYPHQFQKKEVPQFAYYAYGKDYHNVIADKLKNLYKYCQQLNNAIEGRHYCDTAPFLERYWAAKSGMGWVGKNSLLIVPKRGSYFFLSALVLNLELEYDDVTKDKMPSCGNCSKCMDACPTKAIISPHVIDSHKCLSYQTIENKGEIAKSIVPHMQNRVYGCDICQQVCPWNRFASPHSTDCFLPSTDLLNLNSERIDHLNVEQYQQIFKGSAVKRVKLSGLKRNMEAIKQGGKRS